MLSQLRSLDKANARCSRCNTPRGGGEMVCRRCGQNFVPSTPLPAGPLLVLRQLRPRPSDQVWQVSDVAADVGRVGTTIILADQSVSRRHARIAPQDSGFLLDDLGSTNGTYINAHQITSASPIADGDELGFGDVVLVAELRSPAVPPTPAVFETILEGPEPPRPNLAPRVDPGIERTISEEPGAAPNPGGMSPSLSSPARKPISRPSPGAPRADLRPSTTMEPIVIVPPTQRSLRPTPGITDLIRAADEIAARLHEIEPSLNRALQSFETSGGAAAVQALIAQAERVEANPRDVAELQALTAWLPTARRLLEAELTLVTVLAGRGSGAHE